GEPFRRLGQERQDDDAKYGGNCHQTEYPPPRIRREWMHAAQQRKAKDADIDSSAENAGDGWSRGIGPAFGDQGDAVGPHAAHSETDEKSEDKHLLTAGDECAETAEARVKQNAEAHGPCSADAVAEISEQTAADGRAEHECRSEP